MDLSGGVGSNSSCLISSSSSSSLGIGNGSNTGSSSSSSSNITRRRTKTRRQTSRRLQTLRCCCGPTWLIRIQHSNETPQAQTIVPPNSVPGSVNTYRKEDQPTLESRAKKMNRLIFRVLNKTQPPVDDGVQEYTVQRCQEQKIWGWNMAKDTLHLEATAKLLKKRVRATK